MTFVITGACIGVKDGSCVATCPVDCIVGLPGDPMLFIDPVLCVDCAACVPLCPVNAIAHENDVPTRYAPYIAINREYFSDRGAALAKVNAMPREASSKGTAE